MRKERNEPLALGRLVNRCLVATLCLVFLTDDGEFDVASDDFVDVLDPSRVAARIVDAESDHLAVASGELVLQLRRATQLRRANGSCEREEKERQNKSACATDVLRCFDVPGWLLTVVARVREEDAPAIAFTHTHTQSSKATHASEVSLRATAEQKKGLHVQV